MFNRRRSMVSKTPQPSRLLRGFVLAIALAEISIVLADSEADNWRRTPHGWERVESWNHLIEAPIGQLRPLTIATLLQRTWPAYVAATELFLMLTIIQFASQRAAKPN